MPSKSRPLHLVPKTKGIPAYELALMKLVTSGLDEEDYGLLRLEALEAHHVRALSAIFKPMPAIKIPYFTLNGEPLSTWPGCDAFYRLRYLDDGTGGFQNLTDGKKKTYRYAQEKESGIAVYFPQNMQWGPVQADVSQAVFITEGEFKAAKGCREGYPTIGLGGVWNFRSADLGITLVQELETFTWKRRPVYLCFDSDITSNPNVANALNQFSELLMMRGAFPYLIILPPLEDVDKTGLDDFLVGEGIEAFDQLITLAQPLTVARRLWQMNDEVVFTRRTGMIVDLSNYALLSPLMFRETYGNQTAPERTLKKDGSWNLVETSLAPLWMHWPLRGEVHDLTYAPGRPLIFEKEDHWWVNTWPGWGCRPKPGDVSPFTDLLEHLFTGCEPGALLWFKQWLAYPLQVPGTKMYTSVVLHGIKHGTGKTLLGYTMGRIYGKNFIEIQQSDLHSTFTEWAENKQFVLGDDVTGSDKRQDADVLKRMITQKDMRINKKYIQSYTVPDCVNFMFTSNHPDPFFLEDDDRRFFVHEVKVDPLDESEYVDYDLWLKTTGGPIVYHYLLGINCDSFNPAGRAYYTDAKGRMIHSAKSDIASWVARLWIDPETTMMLGGAKARGDLFTNKELLQYYDTDGRTRVTANGLGREMNRAGFVQVNNGNPVRTPHGMDRYYAVRNREKWGKASLKVITNYLNEMHKRRRGTNVELYEENPNADQ